MPGRFHVGQYVRLNPAKMVDIPGVLKNAADEKCGKIMTITGDEDFPYSVLFRAHEEWGDYGCAEDELIEA